MIAVDIALPSDCLRLIFAYQSKSHCERYHVRVVAGTGGSLGGQATPAYPHEVLAVLMRVRDGRLTAMAWRRAEPPDAGRWALPGGLLAEDELLGAALARKLAEKVDVHTIAHLEQLETRSDPHRDPRARVLATAYLGLIPADVDIAVPSDTRWQRVDRLPPMAFDHRSIVRSALSRLRAKLSYTNIAFALAPETFTMAQLRDLYTAALGRPVSATNLNRVLLRRGAVERTEDRTKPSGGVGRPASLYRFTQPRLTVTDEFPVFRPDGSSG
jgi:8-oxo-dGTP diphosphatase